MMKNLVTCCKEKRWVISQSVNAHHNYFVPQILEPIDEVKAQVYKNADSVSHLQATIDEIKEESKQAAVELGEILCLIKDLKQDLKPKDLRSTTKSTIHGLKKFIGKSIKQH